MTAALGSEKEMEMVEMEYGIWNMEYGKWCMEFGTATALPKTITIADKPTRPKKTSRPKGSWPHTCPHPAPSIPPPPPAPPFRARSCPV